MMSVLTFAKEVLIVNSLLIVRTQSHASLLILAQLLTQIPAISVIRVRKAADITLNVESPGNVWAHSYIQKLEKVNVIVQGCASK